MLSGIPIGCTDEIMVQCLGGCITLVLNILYYTLIEERCLVITNGDSVDTEVIDICVNKRHGVVSIDF